jgi:hypothetical protein
MHHPLPGADRKGMILGDFQIVHHLRARHKLVAGDHAVAAIRTQHMHPQLELPDRYKALLFREEGMPFVGVNDFAGDCLQRAILEIGNA